MPQATPEETRAPREQNPDPGAGATGDPQGEGAAGSAPLANELNGGDLDKVSGGTGHPLPPDKQRKIANNT